MKHALLFIALCFAGSTYAQQLWDDFDDNRTVNYGFIHGVLDQAATNPDNTGQNTSPLCASYIRNPSEMFDVIVIDPPAVMDDLADYISGAKSMSIDVYSPEVGTTVQITLEDEDTAGPSNFPTGRHSIFLATTTVANQWETLTFTFDSQPDPTVPNDNVELVILLFDPGSNTGDTYHWDNLMGPEFPDPCAMVSEDPNVFEDFECQRNMTYDFNDGWVTVVENPDPTGENTTSTVGKYVRNAFFENAAFGGALSGELDLSSTNQARINIWDPNAPSTLFVSFQNSSASPVQEFTLTTQQSSTWESHRMDLSNVTPAAMSSITNWVMLLSPGTFSSDSMWFDNFELDGFIPTGICDCGVVPSGLRTWPNPSNGEINLEFNLTEPATAEVQLMDLAGRVVHTEAAPFGMGVQQWRLQPAANLSNGSYILTLRSGDSLAKQHIVLQR